MKFLKPFLIVILVIILDQASKLLVYYNMTMGEVGEIKLIGDWFKLHYTLNPGMAFGLELPAPYGKLILSLFRLVAVFGIGFYLWTLAKRKLHWGLISCVALIMGGAFGNVIDSTFYGVFLENNAISNFFLKGDMMPIQAPTKWFHGQVIDMIFVDAWKGVLPEWMPLLGGSYFSFPIFNIADASIFVGVSSILIFQKRFFAEKDEAVEPVLEQNS